ncbi:Mu transposase C-terminal domain-containing protein [Pseudomonas defluvii]|uniref:Mu transposase C-terminal domain-containing protein n=1 Tax=Pseudomonas defluvii TaxID=1876757 RepID=UPI003905BFD1
MINLHINMILSPVTEEASLSGAVRILDIDSSDLLVIDLKEPYRKPRNLSLEEVRLSLAKHEIKITQIALPAFMLREDSEISDKEKAGRDRCWEIIRVLVDQRTAGELFIDRQFGKLVSERATGAGVSRKRIYSLLYRYWAYGHSKNSFLWEPGRGGPGQQKMYKEGAIPGRPPTYRGVVKSDRAVILDDYARMAMRSSFDLYVAKQVSSREAAHIAMCEQFYSEVLPNGQRGDVIRGSHPTISQFRNFTKKNYDAIRLLEKISGEVRWNKDHRALVGTSVDGVLGPGHRYEVDATIADVYLVHRVNRNWLIGRPVLYFVVDAYSRMITGMHVSLEGPSWESARHALYNAFTSKVDYCKRYNVDITDEDWPCFHVPLEVVADRGELLSNAGETMTRTLGPTLQIAPPFRGDWKPVVESRFRLINQGLNLKFVPGGIDQRHLERIDRDYRLDAVLDIDQFTRIILLQVLVHNRNLHLPHLATPEMVGDDLELTPIEIWKWGMRNNVIKLNIKSDAEIKLGLLPSDQATIRRGGIYFKGLLYTCDLAERERWAERSHNVRLMRRKVWYDPNNTENVWVREDGAFIKLSIVDHQQSKYAGYRFEEVEDWSAAIRNPSPDAEYRKINDAAKVKREVDSEISKAQESKAAGPVVKSKAEALGNVRENRAREAEIEREKSSAHLSVVTNEVRPKEAAFSTKPSTSISSLSAKKKNLLKLVRTSIDKDNGDDNHND